MNSVIWRLVLSSLLLTAGVSACGLKPSVETRLTRAAASEAAGNYATAAGELAAVLKDNGKQPQALAAMARVAFKVGDLKAAESYAGQAVAAGDHSTELHELAGEAMLLQGRNTDVLHYLQKNGGAVSSRILALKAAAYIGNGDLVAAEAVLRAAQVKAPPDARLQIQWAAWHAVQDHLEQAGAALDEAVKADADLLRARLARGNFRLARGQAAQALQDFQFVSQALPGKASAMEQAEALAGAANVYLTQNNLPAAADSIGQLRRVAGNSAQTRVLQGRFALQGGDTQQAVAELSAALTAAPDDAAAATLLGAAQLVQGDARAAIATLQRVVAKNAGNSYARKLLAQALLADNQSAAARQTLSAAGVSAAQDPKMEHMTALALLRTGATAEAVALLEHSAAAAPSDFAIQLELARSYVHVGEFGKARQVLDRIPADRRGKAGDTLLLMAGVAGRPRSEALATLQQLSAGSRGDAEVLAFAGSYALRLGDSAAAARYFDQALQQNGQNVAVLLGAAAVAVQQGAYTRASAFLQQILSLDGANQSALLALANLESRQSNTARARAWLERAISADPAAVPPRLSLAQLEYRAGDTGKAKALLDQVVAVAMDKAEGANAAGMAAQAVGQAAAAEGWFTDAIRRGSKVALLNLARLQAAQGQMATARTTLLQINDASLQQERDVLLIGLDATTGRTQQAMLRLGALRKSGLPEAAAAEVEGDIQMAAKAPALAAPLYERALAKAFSRALCVKLYRARAAGRMRAAETPLQQWLNVSPADAEVRVLLAQHLLLTGDWPAAAEQFELLRQASPREVAVLNNLAWAYYKAGDRRALTTAQAAFGLATGNSQVADTYGWILTEFGRSAEALPILRAAVGKLPANAAVRYHLAMALQRSGDLEGAQRELRAALDTAGEFEERAAAERELKTLAASRKAS